MITNPSFNRLQSMYEKIQRNIVYVAVPSPVLASASARMRVEKPRFDPALVKTVRHREDMVIFFLDGS